MAATQIDLTTPEAVLAAAHQAQTEVPTDAVHCALTRAKAVLYLLMSQLDGDDARCSDAIISDALWGVVGNIELASNMLVPPSRHLDADSARPLRAA